MGLYNVYRALEAVKYFVVFIIQHTRVKVNPVLILSKEFVVSFTAAFIEVVIGAHIFKTVIKS